jgi:hypothetical protein
MAEAVDAATCHQAAVAGGHQFAVNPAYDLPLRSRVGH